MTPRLELVPQDAAVHAAVQALLPWHAAHTLGREDERLVESHLAECRSCQADLRSERELLVTYRALATPGDAERGFDSLRLRIASPRRRVLPASLQRWLHGWRDSTPWVRRALVLQFALMFALGGALLVERAPGEYRALGGAAPVPGNLIVKFRSDTPEVEIRRTLTESGARFAGGPTTSQAYVLAAPAGSMSTVLARLRARPSVTLAESLDATAGKAP